MGVISGKGRQVTNSDTTTKTEIGTATPFPIALPAQSDTLNMAYGIPFMVGAAIFAALKLANKFSRDKVGYTGDRAEEKLIKMLQEQIEKLAAERDRQVEKLVAERDKAMEEAREAWSKANGDAAKIGKLEASNTHLTDRVTDLTSEVKQLSELVHKLRNELAGRKPAAPITPTTP